MKRTTLFFLLFFAVVSIAHAQNTWVQRPNYPGLSREFTVSFVIGTTGYVGTGSTHSGGYRRDFWAWDQLTNTWMQIADFGGTARAAATAFATDGKGYVGLGCDVINRQDFWEYDPIANLWAHKADFPGGPRAGALGFGSLNPKAGFIATGHHNGNMLDELWQYDPQTDTWVQKTSMPAARSGGTGFFLLGKIYIATGCTYAASRNNDLWEWDPATDIWTQRSSMPLSAGTRGGAVSFAMNGRGYVATGQIGIGETNDFWEWDPATDTWVQLANVSLIGRYGATGFAIGNCGYVCGGEHNSQYLPDFWEYSNTVGIEESPAISITLFPVPATDQLTLTFPSDLTNAIMKISDVSGKCVCQSEVSGSSTQKINIESLTVGTYVLEIRSEQGFAREKFVKVRK
jgi:N-acetylneuraminic acid mutarotase